MYKMLTALAMLLSIGTGGVASSARVEASTAFEMDKLPYKAKWGSYTVTVVQNNEESSIFSQFLRIQDGSGKTLREINTHKFIELKLSELTGKGTPELFVTAFDGGAHCCSMSFIFTLEGGLKNLLILNLGNGQVTGLKDLNGDGRAEIIASNDVLSTIGLAPYYSASPWMALVVGWDGSRYVDQTRRYSNVVRPYIDRYRSEFEKVEGVEGTIHGEDAEIARRTAALGFYANSIVVGEGAKAKAWLEAHAPDSTKSWLSENDATIRQATASSNDRIEVSQKGNLFGGRLGD